MNLAAVCVKEWFAVRVPEKDKARAEAVFTRRHIFFDKQLLAVVALNVSSILEAGGGGPG